MTEAITSRAQPQTFPNTRWSVVLAARRETSAQSAAALEVICKSYWYPLYAYVRHSGHSSHDAQDLTQEFFSRLLEKRWLDTADHRQPAHGDDSLQAGHGSHPVSQPGDDCVVRQS